MTRPDFTDERPITWEVRWHIFWRLGGIGTSGILAVWSLAATAGVFEVFGYKLSYRRFGQLREVDAKFTGVMAIIVTVVGLFWYGPRVWRALYLARFGHRHNGTVRRKLGVTLYGFDTVLVSFTVADKVYTAKYGVKMNEWDVGASLPLLYDPAAPARSLPQWQVLPPRVIREEFNKTR
jgi:hypothetical protein